MDWNFILHIVRWGSTYFLVYLLEKVPEPGVVPVGYPYPCPQAHLNFFNVTRRKITLNDWEEPGDKARPPPPEKKTP